MFPKLLINAQVGIHIAILDAMVFQKIKLMRRKKLNSDKNIAIKDSKNIEGRYSNYFKVGHNAFEFVIDFGQYYAETEKAELYSRIVTSPCYAKFLFEILRESIEQYERDFGTIKEK